MNLQNLVKFFNQEVPAELIAEEINSEVEEYWKGLTKIGTSVPIFAENDDFHFLIEPRHAMQLCSSFFAGILGEKHLSYICNIIELSESFLFHNEKVEEFIFQIANPEITVPLNFETIKNICEKL